MLKQLLFVGIGGGLGSILRYLASKLSGTTTFPFATLSVNIIGSFLIGVFAASFLKNQQFSEGAKLFFITGLCGGFTTFSAFSLENMELIQSGKYKIAILYIGISIISCLVATFAGLKLAD